MLRVHEARKPDRYNEAVFDAHRLTQLWPTGIEAVVFTVTSAETSRAYAEAVLRDFRAAYGAAADAVALLSVDLSDAAGDAPFAEPP